MNKKSTTHPAAAQTAARRWARIIGKGEYQATKTGATGWVGGEKINSTPLLRGLNVSGHRSDQLGRVAQHKPGHVGSEVFAAHLAVCGFFNLGAALCGNRTLTDRPARQVGRECANVFGKPYGGAARLGFKVVCEIHARSLALS